MLRIAFGELERELKQIRDRRLQGEDFDESDARTHSLHADNDYNS